jgi:hypothetical protein
VDAMKFCVIWLTLSLPISKGPALRLLENEEFVFIFKCAGETVL